MNTNGTHEVIIADACSAVVDTRPVSPAFLQAQVNAIQEAMNQVMKKDVHYGVIPGTQKPTLYKPGAEKICLMFRLCPKIEKQTVRELPNGHREYEILMAIHDNRGNFIGHGTGSCSTMESKYRYRGSAMEFTDEPVVKEYWQLVNPKDDKGKPTGKGIAPKEALKKLYGGRPGITVGKHPDTGAWVIAIKGERTENPDIADCYNTVLKMAKKRAFVDGTLTCTAASDAFDQDIEDLQDDPYEEPEDRGTASITPAERPAPRVYYGLTRLAEEKPGHAKKAEAALVGAGAKFDEVKGVWASPMRFTNLSEYEIPADQVEAM